MAPIVHGLEASYYDRIHFVYLDIDDPATETFKRQLGFRAQPYFVLLDAQGEVLGQWFGSVPAETLSQALDKALMP